MGNVPLLETLCMVNMLIELPLGQDSRTDARRRDDDVGMVSQLCVCGCEWSRTKTLFGVTVLFASPDVVISRIMRKLS